MGERTVSLRELNQNAGRVVRSVAKSGPVTITDHGRAVAMIVEAPDDPSPLERLVAEGRVEPPASSRPDLPVPVRRRRPAVDLVDEGRDER